MSKIETGQKLWYVENQRPYRQREITVDKVGKKYFTTTESYSRLRIDIKTLRADGGAYSSPGKCYPSQEAFEAIVQVQKAWMEFKRDVDKNWEFEGNVEQIEAARAILGMKAS